MPLPFLRPFALGVPVALAAALLVGPARSGDAAGVATTVMSGRCERAVFAGRDLTDLCGAMVAISRDADGRAGIAGQLGAKGRFFVKGRIARVGSDGATILALSHLDMGPDETTRRVTIEGHCTFGAPAEGGQMTVRCGGPEIDFRFKTDGAPAHRFPS